MATSADETTRSLEEQALRAQSMLGRSGPYGNALFAFEYDQLPKDAKITIELIARGGPFPYTEDGGIYHNLSRDLPGISSLYREFTVLTPMEPGEQPRLRQDGKPHRGKRTGYYSSPLFIMTESKVYWKVRYMHRPLQNTTKNGAMGFISSQGSIRTCADA